MHRYSRMAAFLAVVLLILSACSASGGATTSPAGAAASAPASGSAAPSIDPNSLLGKVVAAGKIRISTDPNYKPFSFLNPDGTYDGFDNATAIEAVKRLSKDVGKDIQIDWQTPAWEAITAGGWGGRFDISIGSMSVTNGRAKVVDFVDPYYYDSGAVAVPKDSKVQALAELNDGKSICVGAATTYEQWLQGSLDIVDPNKLPPPTDPKIVSLETDNLCVQAVAAGRKYDAIVANANGLADQAKTAPIRILDGPPIFTVSVAFALDKAGPDDKSMIAALNKVVADMHADGTLSKLSMKYLEKDVTKKPGS
ncbi:MAG TPA: transporter substrate-binding domain-containing protein [Candidatus Limnocylindrales bacterium]|nr:transporter substrate-binding domain-containing protein [Candidatus Limnocylindrales bacterium]